MKNLIKNIYSYICKIQLYVYRIQSLENRVSFLESYLINENDSKKSKTFFINNDDEKKLSGKWSRVDDFKFFKRSRGLFSLDNALYAGFDGGKNKGALKKYIRNNWHDIKIPDEVDEVPNIIMHKNKIWFSSFSKINGASVWCMNDDKAVLVGNWKNYLGAVALCSYKNKLYTSLTPISKKDTGSPILCHDGSKWEVVIDKHPFWCIYELNVYKGNLYGSTISTDFWGGHLLSLDVINKTWKTIGGTEYLKSNL